MDRRISEDSTSPRLSIVIPAFNEAQRLPRTLSLLGEHLESRPYTWEIIVVNNGSTDGTEEVVRTALQRMRNLRVVSIAERGKGLATKTGVLASTGSVVFLCDADLSMPADQLDRFLDRMAHADIVIGSREAPGARRHGEPRHRHIMGRVFNRLVQAMAVGGINDTQCGFKAFTGVAAADLFSRQTLTGWGFDVELLFLARKLGYSVEELPIDWHFNADTRVRPGIDSLSMFWEVLLVRWRHVLGQYGLGGIENVREPRAR